MAHCRPLASPGTLRRSIGWLVRRDGPLSIRPHADPALLRWLLGFAWSSRPGADARGLRAMAELSRPAIEAYDGLVARGVELRWQTAGTLVAFTDGAELEHEAASLEPAAALGLTELEVVADDAARAIEPALGADIAGIVRLGRGRVVDPGGLLAALRAHLGILGVPVRRGVRVIDIELDGRRPRCVRTNDGCTDADAVVIAAGVDSGRLAARVGRRLPLLAGRGYAIDLPRGPDDPSHLVELGEASMVVVPFADRLRLCGTMELARPDDPPDPRRSRSMLEAVGRYLPAVRVTGDVPPAIVGSRPMSPDDLPLVGPLPGRPDVLVASGHGMLGVTLGPITGVLIADQLDGRASIDDRPFSPARFRW